MTDAASGRVSIERLNSEYVVSREHPAPDHVRVRLDDVMRTRLADVCRQSFAQALDPHDPSVWLIRKLDVAVALAADALEGDQCAYAWGAEIAGSLTRTIARGADGVSVLYFPDRATYLAQFLRDLAAGRAWDRWYYGEFDALRSLPASAAIREALLRQPHLVEAVLLCLGSAVGQVLNELTDRDAQRLYDLCTAPAGVDGDVPRFVLEAALAAWPTLALTTPSSDASAARSALCLYLAVRRECPNAMASIVRSAVDNLLAFRSAVDVAGGSGGTLPAESPLFMRRMAAGDRDLFANVLRTLAPPSIIAPKRAQDSSATLQAFSTAFGGAFLLLPKLVELDVHKVIDNAPYIVPGDKTAAALRALVLLKGLGRARANAALCDPAVSLAAGTESASITETLERAANQVAADAANEVCLSGFLDALVARGRLDLRYLHAEIVLQSLAGMPVLIVRDLVTDTWVYAAAFSASDAAMNVALEHGLSFVRSRAGAAVECLFIDPSLGSAIQDLRTLDGDRLALAQPSPSLELPPPLAGTTLWVSPAANISTQVLPTLVAHLRRMRSAGAELDYLSFNGLPGWLETDARFDLMWSLIARTVLRAFAGRLVGFAQSSPEHLYANFLEGRSFVQSRRGAEGQELVVDLPRVPLHLILRMAGVDGQTYRIPWLGDAQVTLQMRGE